MAWRAPGAFCLLKEGHSNGSGKKVGACNKKACGTPRLGATGAHTRIHPPCLNLFIHCPNDASSLSHVAEHHDAGITALALRPAAAVWRSECWCDTAPCHVLSYKT